jgi:hypothetical protein
MDTSKAQLNFKCPKSWNSMTAEGDGRFCNDCKKVVKDFSGLKLDEVNNSISLNTDARMCGSFRAYQLNKPFGNWRDKIISRYQRAILSLNSGSLLKPVTVFLLFIVMLITGCARRLSGDVAPHTNIRDLPSGKK